MNALWVILNDDKSEVVEVFETEDADSSRHWDKFFKHRAGNVFCRRTLSDINQKLNKGIKYKWYASYYYWEDQSRWGYDKPKGIGWSACMAIPEPLKMLELVE